MLKNMEEISKIWFFGIWDLKLGLRDELFNFSPPENQWDAPILTKKDKLKEEFCAEDKFWG